MHFTLPLALAVAFTENLATQAAATAATLSSTAQGLVRSRTTASTSTLMANKNNEICIRLL